MASHDNWHMPYWMNCCGGACGPAVPAPAVLGWKCPDCSQVWAVLGWKCPDCSQVWAPGVAKCVNCAPVTSPDFIAKGSDPGPIEVA